MRKPTECHCSPDGHRITTTDQKLLRRVRRDHLKDAKQWAATFPAGAVCARWTAYQCLLRLRELRANTEASTSPSASRT